MAFTYVDTLLTDRDNVRFQIGDVVENDGPRPGGRNFSNEEVAATVTSEGTAGKASAGLCEVLAREWAGNAGTSWVGEIKQEYSDRSKFFSDLAADLRLQHGGGRSAASTQIATTRVDGFSNDINAEAT